MKSSEILAALLSLTLFFSMSGCTAKDPAPEIGDVKNGLENVADVSYEGSGSGHGGDLKLAVTVKDHKITGVSVIEHQETAGISDKPLADLPDLIVDHQSLAIDTISGATETSTAILSAAEAALSAAGADIEALKKPIEKEDKTSEVTEKNVDIVIVGGGVAGLSAAVEASKTGQQILLIEKTAVLGGSTSLSGGKILAADSVFQREQGIVDTPEQFADFLIKLGNGKVNEDKLRMIADHSSANIDWLIENGVEFSEVIDTPNPEMTPNRGLNAASGSGQGFITPLAQAAKDAGVEIMMETRGEKLIVDEHNAVVGVEAAQSNGDKILINAAAVILATGGYDRSPELKAEYSPSYADSRTNVGAGNEGDGLIMARDVGAKIIGNDSAIAQILPYGSAMADLFTYSGLFVSVQGERFMDESAPRPVRTPIVLRETNAPEFFIILDDTMSSENITKSIEEGIGYTADTLEELAAQTGMDAVKLSDAVARYNELTAKGIDDDFGKNAELMSRVDSAPYYAIRCTMNTAGTFAGPQTNLNAEVLREDGSVIQGLYAAGEVSSGDLIDKEYPGSGTAIQSFVTMGRIAGETAAEYAKANK